MFVGLGIVFSSFPINSKKSNERERIELNNLIKEKRTALGLTQDELAEKLEVSRQTIISLEKGRYNPSLILAFKIARLFECRIEDVFKPEEE